jgi:hypothetical protein
MIHYFTVNTIAETICFVIAIICLAKDDNMVWKSMILFLFIICITEFMGIYIKRLYLIDRQHVHPNPWLYNIQLIFQIGFISSMFRHALRNYTKIDLIIFIEFLLVVMIYSYEIYKHGIFIYNDLTKTILSIIFVLYSLYYFYLLLKDDNYINLKYSSVFWWIAGALFFYFGSTVVNLFYSKLSHVMITSKRSLSYFVFNVLNILLYSCWSYSFICRKWLTTTSKS